MIELKGRKGKPSLGIYMERQIQRRRWEESSYQNRKSEALNFSFWFDFVFDILDSNGVDFLVNLEVTGAQEVRL